MHFLNFVHLVYMLIILNINKIWGYSKTRFRWLKNLKNKPNKFKLKPLDGYDAKRRHLMKVTH